jgi:hypothetical protein
MTTPLVQDTFVKISPQERTDFFLKLKAKAILNNVGIYLKSDDTYVYFGTADEFTEKGAVIAYDGPFSDIVQSDYADTDFSKAVDLYYRTPTDPDRGLVKNEFTPVPPYEPVLNTNYRDLFISKTVHRVDGIELYFKEGDNFKQINKYFDSSEDQYHFREEDVGTKHKSVANFYYKYTPPPPIVESINGGKSRRRIRKRRQKTKRRSSRRNNKRR